MYHQRNTFVVIGGGAAGFFGAIRLAQCATDAQVIILEKTSKLLSKVKVSGGGRCNVTHHCEQISSLAANYPRGQKELKQLFKSFNAVDTVQWFAERGVELKVEDDGRIFPVSDSSQTIIDCFMQEAAHLKVEIKLNAGVSSILPQDSKYEIHLADGNMILADGVLVATGGHPQLGSYDFLAATGHKIVLPIPSLFTFNDSEQKFKELMGLAVPGAEVRIPGTRFSQTGALLITHWGLSGPSVIKLSAWAAEYLHSVGYNFTVLVSWIGNIGEDMLRQELLEYKQKHHLKTVVKHPLYGLPQRLWNMLCILSGINEAIIWAELPVKQINKLIEHLIRSSFAIKGKTTFKEEFVTCGGVDLGEINLDTMESKKSPGIYFAGEVLNIDGITGGFNFQAAWSTAWLAATNISKDRNYKWKIS